MSISNSALVFTGTSSNSYSPTFLCDDVLDTLLNYIKPSNRLHLRVISKQFCRLIDNKVQAISLKSFPKIEQVQALTKFSCLRELNLSDLVQAPCDDLIALVEALAVVKGIKVLNLKNCYMLTSCALPAIGSFNDLESLNLSYCIEITDDSFHYIGNLTKLRSLDITATTISTEGLCLISHLQNLESLNLNFCKRIKRFALAVVNGFSNLRFLSIKDIDITQESLKEIKDLSKLEYLNVSQCHFLRKFPIELTLGLKNLKELILASTSTMNLSLTYLRNFEHLQRLDLQLNFIADEGIVSLYGLKSLKNLNLRATLVTGACFEHVDVLPNLEFLNLSCSNFNASLYMHRLSLFEGLRGLNLSYTNTSDETLRFIHNLKKLDSLNLESCHAITDKSLVIIKRFSSLTYLNVKATLITRDALEISGINTGLLKEIIID
jgi:hypothetical protein